ncbi:unnamed protein product [Prorocentrum cordatum]|uniref:Uncharacterized protein n=1 Tax=Prorocentrum cordatum TaxID=2364126 RepID=A0ABN9QZ07_9DINO|nr:unnamed protein product [Polarella glacialis]
MVPADLLVRIEWTCCDATRPLRERTAMGCFNEEYTEEICCMPEGGDPAVSDANLAPRRGEAPWQVDEACAHQWGGGANVVAPEEPKASSGAASTVPRCGGERLFSWDGTAVRRVGNGPFEVWDLSPCRWRRCARADLRLVAAVPAGVVWVPPHTMDQLAVLATTSDGPAGGGPAGAGAEVLSLWRPNWFRQARPLERAAPPEERPSVHVLVLDAVSRTALRRAMPRLHEFLLREAAAPAPRGTPAPPDTPAVPASHEVASFSRYHTSQPGGTLSQLFPAFFGGLRRCEGLGASASRPVDAGGMYNVTRLLRKCAAFPRGALRELRRHGYRLGLAASMVAAAGIVHGEGWDYVLPYTAGLMPGLDEDHVDFGCVNAQPYYRLVLEWGRQLLGMHRTVPLFLYTHLQAAHADLDQLGSLDVPLRDHLISLMEEYPEVLFLVASDHGNVCRLCDQRAPLLHVMAPSSLLRARPAIAAALRSNQEQVVSGWDIFETLLHLAAGTSTAASPGGAFGRLLKRGVGQLVASPVKSHQEVTLVDLAGGFEPRSLFRAMPAGRTCTAAGIRPRHCQVRAAVESQIVFCAPWGALSSITRGDHAAADRRHVTAPANGSARQMVCELSRLNSLAILLDSWRETLSVLDPGGLCARLALGTLEYVASDGAGQFTMRFSTREGDPPRLFGASFEVGHASRVTFQQVSQITRYRKYEACTPPGVPADICVCDLQVTHGGAKVALGDFAMDPARGMSR